MFPCEILEEKEHVTDALGLVLILKLLDFH